MSFSDAIFALSHKVLTVETLAGVLSALILYTFLFLVLDAALVGWFLTRLTPLRVAEFLRQWFAERGLRDCSPHGLERSLRRHFWAISESIYIQLRLRRAEREKSKAVWGDVALLSRQKLDPRVRDILTEVAESANEKSTARTAKYLLANRLPTRNRKSQAESAVA